MLEHCHDFGAATGRAGEVEPSADGGDPVAE